jgi:fructose/tagatose bisphosphate aldolase
MSADRPAACFTIHSLAHLRAALTAGAASGRPVVALSAAGASAFAGAAWFAALVEQARAEFPDVDLTAILDCGDRAGDVPAALKLGLSHIIFTGHAGAAERLRDIAAQAGATVIAARPPSCDLLNARAPLRAARIHCESPEK